MMVILNTGVMHCSVGIVCCSFARKPWVKVSLDSKSRLVRAWKKTSGGVKWSERRLVLIEYWWVEYNCHVLSLILLCISTNIIVYGMCLSWQMTDANQVWDVQETVEWMKQLAEVKPLWIEEPTSPDDILGHASISKVSVIDHWSPYYFESSIPGQCTHEMGCVQSGLNFE